MKSILSRRAFMAGAGLLGLAGSAGVAYSVGIEPFAVRIVHYRIAVPAWPEGFRLRIAALADLHVCDPFMPLDHVRNIVDATNRLEVDLVVLLGDYVGDHLAVRAPVPMRQWARALTRLEAPLGIHAILGNHDWWDDGEVMRRRAGRPRIGKALEDAGIPVYENDARKVAKDGHSCWIGGIGDQWAFPVFRGSPRDWRISPYRGVDDVPRLLRHVTDDAPLILMAHEPDIFADLPARVGLTLSGHMHGGQVRIAGFSPRLPSRYGDRYVYGHIVENGRQMVVSGGLGCSFLPVRIGAPPEIVVVELGHAA